MAEVNDGPITDADWDQLIADVDELRYGKEGVAELQRLSDAIQNPEQVETFTTT